MTKLPYNNSWENDLPGGITVLPARPQEPAGRKSVSPNQRSADKPSATAARRDAPAASRDILRRVKTTDISITTRQLSTLLHAGMPLVPALSALAEQLKNTLLGEVVRQIRGEVNSGSTLADALQQHPAIFSPLYINMVRAGEAGGSLELILLKLADLLDKKARLTGRVKSAVTYPALMAAAAVGVIIFLMTFVIPSITKIFIELNRPLPWPTTLLITICAFLRDYAVILAILFCLAIFLVITYLKSSAGKLRWDRLKLRLPMFGPLLLKTETSRLARMLAILLGSGICILKALEIVTGIIQNRYIVSNLRKAQTAIEHGSTIADALKKAAVFPPILYHAAATGEMSGNMEQILTDIAEGYDSEIENTAQSLTALLEPVILLVMGAIVGLIVSAILLPIFEINQAL